MLNRFNKIHFTGIGGIGMSGIAWLCLKKGYQISGSDIKSTNITERLSQEGAKIFIGHRAENIKGADCVVYSSAVLSNNPEITEAKKSRLPLFKRGEFLSFFAEGKRCIAVTGAHGKTTTSSMISTMLKEANLTPSGVVGALVPYLNGNAFIGDGEYFVVEADESDGSFLYLKPDYSVITNIDREHLDYYSDIDQIKKAYLNFMENTKINGAVIYWGDDPRLGKIAKQRKARSLTYGFSKKNDIYPQEIKMQELSSTFNCVYKKKDLGSFQLRIPGEHNILNSMAAILIGLEIGLEPNVIRSAIYQYKGAERRFQIKASIDGVTIIDDYAHHPTEIKATLKAAKNVRHERVVVVFQPHRYTRTKALKKEFSQAFFDADHLILTDIYAASERPIPGVSSMNIYEEIVKTKRLKVDCMQKEKICDLLDTFIKPGDLLMFLGAGDIGKVSGEFIKRLKAKKEDALTF